MKKIYVTILSLALVFSMTMPVIQNCVTQYGRYSYGCEVTRTDPHERFSLLETLLYSRQPIR